jgi:PAS domain S-box-containing protein
VRTEGELVARRTVSRVQIGLTLKPGRATADSCEMTTNTLWNDDWRWIDCETKASAGRGLRYASAPDITARQTAQAAWAAGVHETRQRRQVEEAPAVAIGSWEWDIAAGTIEWSEELCRIFGVEFGRQLSFEEFLALIHPDDRALMQTTVQTAYETCQPYSLEHRILRHDGVVRVLRGRGEVITDDAGSPLRMRGTGEDITKR